MRIVLQLVGKPSNSALQRVIFNTFALHILTIARKCSQLNGFELIS